MRRACWVRSKAQRRTPSAKCKEGSVPGCCSCQTPFARVCRTTTMTLRAVAVVAGCSKRRHCKKARVKRGCLRACPPSMPQRPPAQPRPPLSAAACGCGPQEGPSRRASREQARREPSRQHHLPLPLPLPRPRVQPQSFSHPCPPYVLAWAESRLALEARAASSLHRFPLQTWRRKKRRGLERERPTGRSQVAQCWRGRQK